LAVTVFTAVLVTVILVGDESGLAISTAFDLRTLVVDGCCLLVAVVVELVFLAVDDDDEAVGIGVVADSPHDRSNGMTFGITTGADSQRGESGGCGVVLLTPVLLLATIGGDSRLLLLGMIFGWISIEFGSMAINDGSDEIICSSDDVGDDGVLVVDDLIITHNMFYFYIF
jgi:hypothetical protein